jgi:hypothetical protein
VRAGGHDHFLATLHSATSIVGRCGRRTQWSFTFFEVVPLRWMADAPQHMTSRWTQVLWTQPEKSPEANWLSEVKLTTFDEINVTSFVLGAGAVLVLT